jgi:hypothetical protein
MSTPISATITAGRTPFAFKQDNELANKWGSTAVGGCLKCCQPHSGKPMRRVRSVEFCSKQILRG